MRSAIIKAASFVAILTLLTTAAWGLPIDSPLVMDPKPTLIPTLTPPLNASGIHDRLDPYAYRDWWNTWWMMLQPAEPSYLDTLSVSSRNALEAAFKPSAGWTFKPASTPLSSGSLRVHTYDAQYGSTIWQYDPPKWGRFACPDSTQPDKSGYCRVVGTEFVIEYKPGAGDPLADVHWVQVLTTSDEGTFVDGSSTFPYFDMASGGVSTSRQLFDWPTRGWDIGTNPLEIAWSAELYLVQAHFNNVTDPTEVTVLGGLEWGWVNMRAEAPEPPVLPLVALAVAGMFVGSRKGITRRSAT